MIIGDHSNVSTSGLIVTASVTVGKYTSIAPDVQMHSKTQHACIDHPKFVSIHKMRGYPQNKSENGITIGSDVWIGRNVVLLGNITIGHGAIVGAYAVVAKDVPPYAVVVGNPVQIKRYRFTEDQIKALLKIEWWDWSQEKVREKEKDFLDIDLFIKNNMV